MFRSDLENFYYSGVRRLLKDGRLVREKTWEQTIPRIISELALPGVRRRGDDGRSRETAR